MAGRPLGHSGRMDRLKTAEDIVAAVHQVYKDHFELAELRLVCTHCHKPAVVRKVVISLRSDGAYAEVTMPRCSGIHDTEKYRCGILRGFTFHDTEKEYLEETLIPTFQRLAEEYRLPSI